MAFVQKDRLSRKDKLEKNQAGSGPEVEASSLKKPKAVIHKTADGGQHMHMLWPDEGKVSNPHLEALLAKLENAKTEDSVAS